MIEETAGAKIRDRAAEDLAVHLADRAAHYYPVMAGGRIGVQLLRRESRAVTNLYRFRIEGGSEVRMVLVKVPRGRAGLLQGEAEDEPQPLRPRLSLPLPPLERAVGEYRSLAAIHEQFGALADPRLGTVRVLDLLPEHPAFVMEVVDAPSLRRLLHDAHRGCRPEAAARPLDAFHNAGVWLREYHGFTPPQSVDERRTNRAAYSGFIADVTEYLSSRLGDRQFFGAVGETLRSAAEEVLAEELPLGVAHGDFAPRNILVAGSSRVTVLDTLTRFRTPIYEDIGYFLVNLRHNWMQLSSLGAAFPVRRLNDFESAFLSGYFGARPLPAAAVRLYELLAALDLWAGTAALDTRLWRGSLERSARLALLKRGLGKRLADEVAGLRRGTWPRPIVLSTLSSPALSGRSGHG